LRDGQDPASPGLDQIFPFPESLRVSFWSRVGEASFLRRRRHETLFFSFSLSIHRLLLCHFSASPPLPDARLLSRELLGPSMRILAVFSSFSLCPAAQLPADHTLLGNLRTSTSLPKMSARMCLRDKSPPLPPSADGPNLLGPPSFLSDLRFSGRPATFLPRLRPPSAPSFFLRSSSACVLVL